MPKHPSSTSQGLTLIEVVVGIAIVGIISVMIATSLPYVRQHQQVKLAAQQIISDIRRAQQVALYETRDPRCINEVGEDEVTQRHCSDVGVIVKDQQIITFADTIDDDIYTADKDFILSAISLPGTVIVSSKSFLFEATPPTITMYVNGAVRAAHQTENLDITSGTVSSTIAVSSYGFLEPNATTTP